MNSHEARRVARGASLLLAGMALTGCGSHNRDSIKNCPPGYRGPRVTSSSNATRAFQAESVKLADIYKGVAVGQPIDHYLEFVQAYDEVFDLNSWTASSDVNTVDQAGKILCVESEANNRQLVLNQHAESVRQLLRTAGVQFDLNSVLSVGKH